MNIPLILGEACLEIGGKIQEVIRRLEEKARIAPPGGIESRLLQEYLVELRAYHEQFYQKMFQGLMASMSKTLAEMEARETVSETLDALARNVERMEPAQHNVALGIFQALDRPEYLTNLLRKLSDPREIERLTEKLSSR